MSPGQRPCHLSRHSLPPVRYTRHPLLGAPVHQGERSRQASRRDQPRGHNGDGERGEPEVARSGTQRPQCATNPKGTLVIVNVEIQGVDALAHDDQHPHQARHPHLHSWPGSQGFRAYNCVLSAHAPTPLLMLLHAAHASRASTLGVVARGLPRLLPNMLRGLAMRSSLSLLVRVASSATPFVVVLFPQTCVLLHLLAIHGSAHRPLPVRAGLGRWHC